MNITANPAALKRTSWREYGIRFALGGVITLVAGLIAKEWGPRVGGLFLAFPAIFPASVTLVARHAREEKQQHGMNGTQRGREAAALDAFGAVLGSIGLLAFGCVVWQVLPDHATWWVLIAASLAWLAASVLAWLLQRRL